MEYIKLGKTGLTISRICLGCMTYGTRKWREWVVEDPAEVRAHFALALEQGVNFFDTANVYSDGASEELTGRMLNEMASRDEIVVATKVYMTLSPRPNRGGLSRKHIIDQCDASLRRLGMDFIDLYQIHRFDPATPIEETLEALDALVRAGKVRYLGASSMAAWQFAKMLFAADLHHWQRFVAMQNHYNLVYREEEREMIPLCIDQGVAVIPWSPLARGLLAGNRKRGGQGVTKRAAEDQMARNLYRLDSDYEVADACESVARKRGVTPAQIACAWILQAPGVSAPIVGTTRLEHIREVIGAVEIKLSAEEIAELEKPYQPHQVLGHAQPTPAAMSGRGVSR
ncbi:MAG TPA: aldo/keto reductase [Candidatus Binataceae bacterium]|nr:aldo/keto reductase [Candidatus Binataceae bacterium]